MKLTEQFEDKLTEEMGGMIEDALNQGFPIISAVTPKYIYMSLFKTWGSLDFTGNTGRTQSGATFVTPPGAEIIVAIERLRASEVEEDLVEGAITIEELIHVLKIQSQVHDYLFGIKTGLIKEEKEGF